ncbi:Phosphorylase b kinase regulatory subunit alpha [Blyttiomyces sp. JEL0837]|nr:Phosphorylase b kinase regulatory subunit alpha [Blyttiomyces sp. JEL0837]
MPSNGRWLRRRKNDGALNRAPPDFYPKVWNVLSKCHGILVGKDFLPRDPTVSEKTPEEFNFALQVESYLDVIRDPAERQIAVECLMVISRIAERNPEIQISSGPLDLMRVIRDAVSQYWIKWTTEQTPAGVGAAVAALSDEPPGPRSPLVGPASTGISPQGSFTNIYSDTSFERNERLARRLFFDLPQEGREGSMSYLAKSCVRICFDVSWAGDNTDEMGDSLGVSIRTRRDDVTIAE